MAASQVQVITAYLDQLRTKAANKFGLQLSDVRVGHAILQVLDEHADFVGQVDVQTGESETNRSIRDGIIRLSVAFTKAGLKVGDVILLAVPNGLKFSHEMFTGMVNGLPVLPVDSCLLQLEIQDYIKISNPKLIVCNKDNENIIDSIINEMKLNVLKIVLDDPEKDNNAFVNKYKVTKEEVDAYISAPFDDKLPAWLLSTSGTTGKPKLVIMSHENLWFTLTYFNYMFTKLPKPTKALFIVSSPQWMTATTLYCVSTLLVIKRCITTAPLLPELCRTAFKQYKPTMTLCSPTKLLEFQNEGCDLSSLEYAFVGGSALIASVEKRMKEDFPFVRYLPAYGMTELVSLTLCPGENGPSLNIGKEFTTGFQYRLVHPDSGVIVTEPNVPGELHVKSASPFAGYYNNPEETANIKTEDGFVKTGDLFYKDKEGYYFFIERLKIMLKYKTYQVYPTEIEAVLCGHPAVAIAGVAGIPNIESGEVPIALVQLKNGFQVSAKELCDLVASKLSDSKKIRGGVIFVDKLPLTPSCKLNRGKLKQLIVDAKIEF